MNALTFIGWFYTIIGLLALLAGIRIVKALRAQGRKPGFLDSALFGVWFLGLAGGMGVLLRSEWGLSTLTTFCWLLIVLVGVSVVQRFVEAVRMARANVPVNFIGVMFGLLLVAVPFWFLCYMTLSVLKDESTRAAFGLS